MSTFYELLDSLFLLFFPSEIISSYSTIFHSFEIVFAIMLLVFIFFGLASLASRNK